jgi:ABC-2 type transport system ATP-binding protein
MIEVRDVRKLYGDKVALGGVSFSIAPGEVVGFLGLNGAGKTTMLKILCGLLLPSAGSVVVDGIDAVADPLSLRRRIGFLPDRPPLYGDMTVRQMLTYAGRLNGVSAAAIDGRVAAVLGLAELDGVKDDLVETLSHGYRQRVGIAQAIVHEPKLVVLDEPISGLDPAQIVAMRSLIRGLKEKHTVLLSSHILGEISHTADRILVLHGGRVVAQGTEAELTGGGGRRKVEIVARGLLPDLEKGALLRAAGIDHASAVELVGQQTGLLRLRASFDNDATRERLVKALVEQGFGIRTVVELESDLEALFLALTAGTSSSVSPTSPAPAQTQPGGVA